MSDNVVLSKHFDSLASAVQRYISNGYAPTAYVPAGQGYTVANTPSTVDGGLWYELENGVPVLKMHYKHYDITLNTTAPADAQLVFDLRTIEWSGTTDYTVTDNCGSNWEISGINGEVAPASFTYENSTERIVRTEGIAFGRYSDILSALIRTGDITLGDQDFTISFQYKTLSGLYTTNTFLRLYNSDIEDGLAIMFNKKANSEWQFSVRILGTTYTGETIYSTPDSYKGNNFELDYFHEAGEMKIFNDGVLKDTLQVTMPETTFAYQMVGDTALGANPQYDYILAEIKLYNGIACHSSDFTPEHDYIITEKS